MTDYVKWITYCWDCGALEIVTFSRVGLQLPHSSVWLVLIFVTYWWRLERLSFQPDIYCFMYLRNGLSLRLCMPLSSFGILLTLRVLESLLCSEMHFSQLSNKCKAFKNAAQVNLFAEQHLFQRAITRGCGVNPHLIAKSCCNCTTNYFSPCWFLIHDGQSARRLR